MKPSNREFRQIFDNIASRYNAVCSPYMTYRRKTILGQWTRGKCLEVGAGTGEISKFLLETGYNVVATDIAPGMVREIKKLGLEAYECDAEKLPFEDRAFDTIIAAEMLFYLNNPSNFLNEAYRVLRPGGRLLISCANDIPAKFYDKLRAALRRLGIYNGTYFEEDPLREFMTIKKLRQMLYQNSFKVVEEKIAPVLPVKSLAAISRLLEKTPLRYFGVFIFIFAKKSADNQSPMMGPV